MQTKINRFFNFPRDVVCGPQWSFLTMVMSRYFELLVFCWYYVLLHTSQSKSSSSMQIPVTVFYPGVTVGGRVLLIVIFLKRKQKVIQ